MRSGSACAKFILGGEHSIVQGGRALAFPLPSLRLRVEESDDFRIQNQSASALERATLSQLRAALGLERAFPRGFSITSDIPMGMGLGSSAALCVALLRAAGESEPLALKAIEGEKLFHARSSGLDPTVIAEERPLLYRREPWQAQPLATAAFSAANLRFVLRSTGVPHRTATLQQAVARVREETPLLFADLMDALSSNVESMRVAFEKEPGPRLGQLMNDSHFRLLQLGVSTPELDDLCDEFRAAGAFGAKLTGAGGGGFALGLFSEEKARAYRETNPETIVWPEP